MEHRARIEAYFEACGAGSPSDIAAHFTDDAVVYDTNIRPMRTAAGIGASWVKVRDRWQGARWYVDSCISNEENAEGRAAAIEWSMTGTNPDDQQSFVFRGSEHYRFETDDNLISEIRQYWTFDPQKLSTGLVDYDYDEPADAG